MKSRPKPEEKKEPSGPRLNDQINAKFVRLVTDDGVISFAVDSLFFFLLVEIPMLFSLLEWFKTLDFKRH